MRQYISIRQTTSRWRVYHQSGHVDITSDGVQTWAYYVRDRLGSTRVVISAQGVPLQAFDYYPSGIPVETYNTNNTYAATNRLHTGKEFHPFDGLSWHDNAARFHDTLFPRFTTVDPLAEKYPDLSPYAFCNNNPLAFVDLDGNDVAILPKTLHVALLIQGQDSKWYYYSINGDVVNSYTYGSLGRPFDDIGVGPFDSPQDFLDSKYNTSKGQYDSTNPRSNSYAFETAYRIETTPEQDKIMAESMINSSKKQYNLFTQNCATAVKDAINKAMGTKISGVVDIPDFITDMVKKIFPKGIEYTRGRAPEKNKKSITKAKKMSDPKTKRDDEERTEQGTEDDWR